MSGFLPVILGSHIALAIGLILPSLLLPFALRRGTPGTDAGGTTRGLLWLQANGTLIFGFGLALTGILLVLAIGPDVLSRPWLAVALVIYATNLLLAFFIQRPNLRRLLGATGDRRSRRGRALAGTRPPTALRELRDGPGGRPHRLPDEHQARALVACPAR